MLIDCGSCMVRGDACADCVVTFLTIPVRADAGRPTGTAGLSPTRVPALGGGGTGARAPQGPTRPSTGAGGRQNPVVDLDDAERAALEVLARSGLVPPLRLRAV